MKILYFVPYAECTRNVNKYDVYTNQHYQMASTKSWLRNEEPIRISSDQFELNAQ